MHIYCETFWLYNAFFQFWAIFLFVALSIINKNLLRLNIRSIMRYILGIVVLKKLKGYVVGKQALHWRNWICLLSTTKAIVAEDYQSFVSNYKIKNNANVRKNYYGKETVLKNYCLVSLLHKATNLNASYLMKCSSFL